MSESSIGDPPSFPTLAIRLSGIYLALATFGFGILMERVVYPTALMFGGRGFRLAPRPDLGFVDGRTDKGFYFVTLAAEGLLLASAAPGWKAVSVVLTVLLVAVGIVGAGASVMASAAEYPLVLPSSAGARGLALGNIFSRAGVLVASVAQEGLIRPLAE